MKNITAKMRFFLTGGGALCSRGRRLGSISRKCMNFHHRWANAVVFIVALNMSALAHAAPVSGQGTWETTLQARTFDGTTIGGYYDTALNITWLANADSAGSMNWANAHTWVAGLNINGITGWRLPTTGPVNGSSLNYNYSYDGSTDFGYNVSAPGTAYAGSTSSEMAHMFYVTLGDKAYYNTSGTGPQAGWSAAPNTGPFSNLGLEWADPEWAPNTSLAWAFQFGLGNQGDWFKTDTLNVWAVHSGDVGASIVPVPAAVWLLGSGVIGLLGIAQHKKTPA